MDEGRVLQLSDTKYLYFASTHRNGELPAGVSAHPQFTREIRAPAPSVQRPAKEGRNEQRLSSGGPGGEAAKVLKDHWLEIS